MRASIKDLATLPADPVFHWESMVAAQGGLWMCARVCAGPSARGQAYYMAQGAEADAHPVGA